MCSALQLITGLDKGLGGCRAFYRKFYNYMTLRSTGWVALLLINDISSLDHTFALVSHQVFSIFHILPRPDIMSKSPPTINLNLT